MTRCLRHGPPNKRRWRVTAAAALPPLLVGCGGAAAPVQLPAKPPPAATRVATSATAVSARQQVIAALAGYTTALSEADKSRNAQEARRLLQPYLAATRIDGVIETMSSIWSEGKVFFGEDVLHVQGVTITGQSAFVHDCDDTSRMGLAYRATGQVVPGSTGISELNVVTNLALVGGRWLVQFQLVEDLPCTP
jgi:hypothetical protein